MSLVINHNLMAMNAARNLGESYGRLSTSTRRLSSGLRVGTAADDAAGLAIRELMRSDIRTMNQGIRNANDAVSMVQTADGALQVIDEKLIRMKELAEQAATGTYNSDQRLMIDSEYQAMASEITRIAMATDFNGVKLLDGNLSASHNGSGLNPEGAMKIHFGTGNDSDEDYYYININNMTAAWLGPGIGNGFDTNVMLERFMQGMTSEYKEVFGQEPDVNSHFWSFRANFNNFMEQAKNTYVNDVYGGDESKWIASESPFQIQNRKMAWANSYMKQTAQNGGTFGDFDSFADSDYMKPIVNITSYIGEPDGSQVSSSIGTRIANAGVENAGSFAGNSIQTQSSAQAALNAINDAIIDKDKARASLGALQNRLENTINNLAIQAENLQAAESRISDVDVAKEMTEFVRNQILTQAAVAMLAQANSLPRMAMQLIGGG